MVRNLDTVCTEFLAGKSAQYASQVISFERRSSEERISFLTYLVFSTIEHRLRSESQHAGVWMGPKEEVGAGPQRINGEYKQNKEAERSAAGEEGKGHEAKGG